MGMIKQGLLVASIALLSACSGGEASSSRHAINDGEGGTSQGGTGGSTGGSGGTGGALECPQGGKFGAIRVTFNCTSVDVESCKDLSNIVLEFSDGTRQRFEGLNDTDGSFSGTGSNAGKTIVGVWVKAGNNKSGDGPGYGERFDAPATNCTDGGAGGTGGTGGSTGGTGGSTGGTGGSTGGTGGGNGGSGGTPYDPPN